MGSGRQQVPPRIAWALDLLDLEPTDRVLELGCGTGVAAVLVADRVPEGHVTAIDRSATAIARAAARGAGHVASGRLLLQRVALADFRSAHRVDKAFGVNVNVFWTTPADAECRVLADVLVPGGLIHLVYEAPGGRDVTGPVGAALEGHGFAVTAARHPEAPMVCVTGLAR